MHVLDKAFATTNWSVQSRYALALGIFALALALRLSLFPLSTGLTYLTFYPGLAVSLLLCGLGPGILVSVLSAVTAYFAFFPPHWSFKYSGEGLLATTVFLLTALIWASVTQALHNYGLRLQRIARELRVSEQRYRAVLEDQTDIVSRYSQDRTLLVVNDAFCRLVGRPRESLVGQKWGPIPVAEDVPMIEEGLSRLSPSNPVVTIENRIRRADGRIRWLQFVNRGFFDEAGRLTEIQSVGRDVTERKELQDQLIASAREIEDLYDSAPCGYHSLDANGTYVRINATELGWIGCRRDEVVGKLKLCDFFTEPSRVQFLTAFPQFVRTGSIGDLEYDLVGRNGQARRVSISATSVRDAAGAFRMSRAVMHDVTDRHRALQALKAMTEQLEERVAERTGQLRALVSDLEAAEDRERRQIARDLHDDLGQTLAAASVRLADMCSDTRDDVRGAAQTVAALIDQATASTRALASQLAPAVLYELGLAPALEWLCEDIGRTFGLDASVHDDGRPKPLSQDARAILYRAVRELLINVAKHARTDNAVIEVGRADGQIVIRVTDSGLGYDPAALATKPRRGLGLVSVRERLSFIGGKLEVQSLPGHGTVALLSAPLSLHTGVDVSETAA